MALQLAEVGVILLMFGVGLKFSLTNETYNVILAAALISIALNPLLFRLVAFAGKTKTMEDQKPA